MYNIYSVIKLLKIYKKYTYDFKIINYPKRVVVKKV